MSAVGVFSEQAANIADVISRSTNFQTETGTADAAAALAYCKRILERDVDDIRPKAVIGDADEIEFDRWGFATKGTIKVRFERDVEEEYRRDVADGDDNIHPEGPDPLAAFDAMATWVAAVLEDMMLEFRNAGNLMVQSAKRSKVLRSEADEFDKDGTQIDYFVQEVTFTFGTA